MVGPASSPFDPRPVETPRLAPASEAQAEEKNREEEVEESENERLLIFSDAIVAFAITIAAVPLRVPKDLSTVSTNFAIELIGYILGFVLMYGLWRDHHSIFHHLKRNDTWLIGLNMLFLVLIVLIPVGFIVMISDGFGTRSTFDHDQLQTLMEGMGIFFGGTFCASLVLLLIWISAQIRPARLFGQRTPEKPYTVYMTLRIIMRPLGFAAYTAVIFALVLGYWTVALGVFIGLVIIQLLVLGLYRHFNRDVLHQYLGREETTRLQLFSDAVFAVAITIIIAQIDPAAPVDEIWSLVGTFIFILIFLVVFWLLHYRIFRFARRLNGTLIGWNFFFLLLVILDFTTARLYTTHRFTFVASLPFSLYQMVIASVLALMWGYMQKHKPSQEKEPSLIKQGITRRQRWRLSWVVNANPCIFVLLALAGIVTPFSTTIYVAAYVVLLGLAWLIGVLITLRLPMQTIPEVKTVIL